MKMNPEKSDKTEVDTAVATVQFEPDVQRHAVLSAVCCNHAKSIVLDPNPRNGIPLVTGKAYESKERWNRVKDDFVPVLPGSAIPPCSILSAAPSISARSTAPALVLLSAR